LIPDAPPPIEGTSPNIQHRKPFWEGNGVSIYEVVTQMLSTMAGLSVSVVKFPLLAVQGQNC